MKRSLDFRHNEVLMLNRIKSACVQLRRREEGVTALEYALIAGIIITAIVGSVTTLGQATNGAFERYERESSAAMR